MQKIGRYGLAGGTGKVGLRLVTNRRLRWTRSLYQAWTNHQNALLIPSSTKLGPSNHLTTTCPQGARAPWFPKLSSTLLHNPPSLSSLYKVNATSTISLYQGATSKNHLISTTNYREFCILSLVFRYFVIIVGVILGTLLE